MRKRDLGIGTKRNDLRKRCRRHLHPRPLLACGRAMKWRQSSARSGQTSLRTSLSRSWSARAISIRIHTERVVVVMGCSRSITKCTRRESPICITSSAALALRGQASSSDPSSTRCLRIRCMSRVAGIRGVHPAGSLSPARCS